MKRHAPAAARNVAFILEVLREQLLTAPAGDDGSTLLEVASGTGQHAAHFAAALPHLTVQPSDLDPTALASIAAHVEEASLPNLRPPLVIDVTADDWGEGADAILCVNMIHIAPWEACLGLLRGAGRVLPASGALMLYGPFRFDGTFTAPSNATFDASLRHRDPAWGVRDLADVTREAEAQGLRRTAVIDMPANNHVLVFRR